MNLPFWASDRKGSLGQGQLHSRHLGWNLVTTVGCHVSSSSECLLRRCRGLAGSVGRIWQAYCKPSCSWLPGREELYSAAITEGVKSIGQPFNGEWAALSLAPGGSRLNREGLCALKEELKSVAITYPISERDKLRLLLERELAARFLF